MQKSKCPKLQTANLPSNKGTPRQLNDGFLPQYPAITVCLYNDFITGGVWWNYEDDYGDKKEELFNSELNNTLSGHIYFNKLAPIG